MTGTPEDRRSPRDRFVTVYGRKPVLEALGDPTVAVDSVRVARGAGGPVIAAIEAAAAERGVAFQRVTAREVSRVSRAPRQDQGVVADLVAPGLDLLEAWLARLPAGADAAVLVLDGVTNPQNVGIIARSAVAAGLEGVVLPRAGSPEPGPLVVKASAGVALRAPLLRSDTAAGALDALERAGFAAYGLAAGSSPLWELDIPSRAALVVGGETAGVSAEVAARVHVWVGLPLAGGVDSLNVAAAATVVAYEIARRRHTPTP